MKNRCLTDRSSSWTNNSDQIWTYVSDRTGILAVANLPILWLFAGRNDVFLWLTGWNFGTFNMFHRWVARVSTVEAIVHSIAYTYIYAKGTFTCPYWKKFDILIPRRRFPRRRIQREIFLLRCGCKFTFLDFYPLSSRI